MRKHIFSRAWNITWKHKLLWIFGFIAGITLSSRGGTTDFYSSGAWFLQELDSLTSIKGTGITLIIIAFAVFLWLFGLLARAGLIHATIGIVTQRKQQINLNTEFGSGLNALPKLVGMQMLVWSPIVILNLWPATLSNPFQDNSAFLPLRFAGFSVIALISSVLFLALLFVDAFAFRSIVIDSVGVIDSVQNSFQILRNKSGRVFTTAVLVAIIGFIVAIVIGIPITPILATITYPLTASAREVLSQCADNNANFEAMAACIENVKSMPAITATLFLSNIILAALYSVWTVFLSVVFTLLYKDIAPHKRHR